MQVLERFRAADADRVPWGHLVKGWIKGHGEYTVNNCV